MAGLDTEAREISFASAGGGTPVVQSVARRYADWAISGLLGYDAKVSEIRISYISPSLLVQCHSIRIGLISLLIHPVSHFTMM
jgi:hypothetical protein